jgi:prepilin-type N-terminal cleavage/methylation domain-containing protein
LVPPAIAECGLLNQNLMAGSHRDRLRARVRTAQGFSLIELLMVVAIIGVLAAIAIGITPGIIQTAKGQSGAQQVAGFLKRHRELAISRRRNIEIWFTAPNQLRSIQRAVPDPPNPLGPNTPLESMYFEGRLEYRQFAGIGDTPDAFGAAAPVILGGVPPTANPVMFTSEGSFTDVDGNPVNASIFLGIVNQRSTANAVTIIGTTAAVRTWRYLGPLPTNWVQ